jgi:hypothetical protein
MLSDKEFEKLNQEAHEHANREYEEVQNDKEYSPEEALALGAFEDDTISNAINKYQEEQKAANELYDQLDAEDINVFASPGPFTWQGKLLYSPILVYSWIKNLWR